MSMNQHDTNVAEATNVDEAALSTTPTNDEPNSHMGNLNLNILRDANTSTNATSIASCSSQSNNCESKSSGSSNNNMAVSPLLINGINRSIANITQSARMASQLMDLSFISGEKHMHNQTNDWTSNFMTKNDVLENINGSPLSTSSLSSSSSPSSSSASTSSSELNPSDALQAPLTGLLDFEGFSMPQIGNFGYSLPSLPNLDMPNFSDLASLPTLPSFNMPNLTNLQNLANLPNLSNLPNLTNLPNLPNLARFRPTNLPNLPTLPHLPLFSASFARSTLLKPWPNLMESVRNMHKRLNDITQRYPTNFHFREWRAPDGTPFIRVYFILNDALYYCDGHTSEHTSIVNNNAANNKLFSVNNCGNLSASSGSRDCVKEATSGHHTSNKHRSNRNIYHYKQLDIKNLHTQLPHPTSLITTSQDMTNNTRRLQQPTSIANYEYDQKSSRFVFSLGANLYYFDDNPGNPPLKEPPHIPFRIETNHLCHKSQPLICPSNPDLIAFYSDGDLWCVNVKTCQEVRLTDSIESVKNLNHHNSFINGWSFNNKQHTNVPFHRPSPTALDSSPILIGRPSHVIQEEFKRHESFWWRQDGEFHVVVDALGEYSEYELLYEETDQSMVDLVQLPSWDGQIEGFRYPRTGTANAVSKLRLVKFKLSTRDQRIYDISQVDIPAKLSEVYPEYEYLVRVGWLSQDSIWCQMLNRRQTNLVLVVISLSNSFRPQILYEDKCDKYWIKVHDIIHFLNVPKIDYQPLAKGSELTFVWSAEETGHRHLYLIRAQLTGDDSPSYCHMYSDIEDNNDYVEDSSAMIDLELGGIDHHAAMPSSSSSVVRMDESPQHDTTRMKSACLNNRNNLHKNNNKNKYNYPSTTIKRSKQSQLRSKIIFKKQLTFGEWEVSDKEFWVDENEMLIYFCGLRETPLEKQLYVLSYADYLLNAISRISTSSDMPSTSSGSSSSRHAKIRRLTESNFSHSHIAFNSSCNIFVNIQSNISIPPFGFVNRICRPEKALEHNSSGQKLTPNQAIKLSHLPDGKRLAMLLVNSINYPSSCTLNSAIVNNSSSTSTEGKNRHMSYLKAVGPRQSILLDCEADQIDLLPGLAKPELFGYKLSSGNVVYGFIFKPEFMESGMRYPTVLEVYGGPEIQQVSNNFMSVRQPRRHLLSSEGYVVVSFDCRGSSHRGMAFEAHLHRRMGQVEINDQAEVLQWLAKNTGYIDLNRVAVQGWSYGGYLSLMALAQRPDIFKIAIAGSPVTNWFLYDTGYTERFMDLPTANVEGYNKGNVSNYANQFPNEENRLLLLHGLMDENVHFAHTVSFIQALIRAGKPYSLQVYPEERHSLSNSKSCEHFETCILSYLQQYL